MFHGLDDAVGILILHLDKGKALHEINTTNLHLVAFDIGVNQAHNLSRVHLIYLAHIQEKACVTLFWRVVAFPTRTLFALFRARGGLYLWCIGVILQETAKLTTQYTLDKVLLIQPSPTFLHLFHKGSYLFLVNLNALYVINHMIKLLAAYLARLWQRTFLELFLDYLLHQTDFALLPQVDDTEAGALLASTTCTTASVRIVLHVIRHTVVDDVCQVVHIQSSGCHIRCHQQLGTMLAELLHGQVALLLGKVAMQSISIITITNQVVSHLLRLHSGTTEYNGIDTRIEVHQTLQGQVLILGVHHIIDMIDVFSSLVAATHLDLALLLQVVLGNTLYLLTHGSTEEKSTVLLRNTLEDSIQLLLETHRKHLVSLIQHYVLNLRQVGCATFHQIHQAARGGYNDIYPSFQGTNLWFDVGSAIYRQDGKVRQIFAKTLHIIGDLYTKFTCWRKDNSPWHYLLALRRGFYQFQDRKTVCCGLSCSCLGKGDQISRLLFVQQEWDYCFLNWHGMFISLFLNSL